MKPSEFIGGGTVTVDSGQDLNTVNESAETAVPDGEVHYVETIAGYDDGVSITKGEAGTFNGSTTLTMERVHDATGEVLESITVGSDSRTGTSGGTFSVSATATAGLYLHAGESLRMKLTGGGDSQLYVNGTQTVELFGEVIGRRLV